LAGVAGYVQRWAHGVVTVAMPVKHGGLPRAVWGHQWDDRKGVARLARQSASMALNWRRHQAMVTDLKWDISCRARVRRGTRCVALVPLGDLVGHDLRVTDDGNVLNAKEVSVMKAPQQAVVLSSVVGIGT